MRTTQKRGNAERAEKRGERGNPEWGARTYAKKGGQAHDFGKMGAGHGGRLAGECNAWNARSSGRKRRDFGWLRGGAMGSVAEEEQKMHGRAMGGKLSFRKAEGKAISE